MNGMSLARDPFTGAATTIRTDSARRPSSDGMFLATGGMLKNPFTPEGRPQPRKRGLLDGGTQLSMEANRKTLHRATLSKKIKLRPPNFEWVASRLCDLSVPARTPLRENPRSQKRDLGHPLDFVHCHTAVGTMNSSGPVRLSESGAARLQVLIMTKDAE